MKITTGKKKTPQKVVIYGPEGIGKTTFASKFPNPLFIDTEDGSGHVDVMRFEEMPKSWDLLMQQVEYVLQNGDSCKTIVIDTADWSETLCKEKLCSKNKWSSIAEPGYGAGYVELEKEFGKLLNLCTQINKKGHHVVIIAHSQMRKFEQPDQTGSYDRYELKLEKKTAALLKEWADALIFLNYQTFITNKNKSGSGKATGGKRVMYLNHLPVLDAKNRWGLSEEMYPMDFSVIDSFLNFEENVPKEPMQKSIAMTETAPGKFETEKESFTEEPVVKVDPKLEQLMNANNVTIEEVLQAVYMKGYFPDGTPYASLPQDFIDGVLIGAWNNGLLDFINDMKSGKKIEL